MPSLGDSSMTASSCAQFLKITCFIYFLRSLIVGHLLSWRSVWSQGSDSLPPDLILQSPSHGYGSKGGGELENEWLIVPFHACRKQKFQTFAKVTNSFENLMRATNSLPPKLTDVIFCVGANSLRETQHALKPDLGLPCGHLPGCHAHHTYDIYASSFSPHSSYYEFIEFLLRNNSLSHSFINSLLRNYFMLGITFCTEHITDF